jgi:cell wall assembly regulator SMI1
MKDYWTKIENWIKLNHPVMIETLKNAASEKDFEKIESFLGNELPMAFKEFYSIHNGQVWTHLTLFDGDRLLSLAEILEEWNTWNAVMPEIDINTRNQFGQPATSLPDAGIKADWWNSSWIPFTSNGCGDSFCIDLSPTSEGTNGQIIRMWHDDPARELIASSFKEWIETYVTDLEKGVYESSNSIGWGGILKKET